MFDKPRIPVRALATEGMLPSRLQRRIYRRRGYRVAADVAFAPGVVIDGEDVTIGPGTTFGFGTVIRGRKIEIGPRVHIGSFCFFDGRDIRIDADAVFREQVFVGGPLLPDSLLHVGRRVKVFQMCFLNPSRPLVIGDDTGVGGRSSLFTHGSWQSVLDGYPVAFAPITIGKNVWLPWHVFILPGVELGDDVTIGAGSVVNRSIPAGSLAAGVPAKVLRGPEEWPRRIDDEERWSLGRGIFLEFCAFARDNGATVDVVDDSDSIDATLAYEHERARIRFERATRRLDAGAADIVASLDVPPELAATSEVSWFDLTRRSKGGAASVVADEIEEFIGRYGVRFAPVHES